MKKSIFMTVGRLTFPLRPKTQTEPMIPLSATPTSRFPGPRKSGQARGISGWSRTRGLPRAGPILANLYASTTGTDADWIVKLIDVYPGDAPNNSPDPDVKMGDFQMLLAGEVFRSKYRKSFEHPEPMVPEEVTEIEFELRDKYHTFLKGHRIMVQVQSTWFPVIDSNPQEFVDIYHAREENFQKTMHKVFRSKKFPSHLKVKVIKD
jgi:predicted acyl esterase